MLNAYIGVNGEMPPENFICNARKEHIGPRVVHGHTPPQKMTVQCSCIDCLAELAGEYADDYLVGLPWGLSEDFSEKRVEYVGIYRRPGL